MGGGGSRHRLLGCPSGVLLVDKAAFDVVLLPSAYCLDSTGNLSFRHFWAEQYRGVKQGCTYKTSDYNR